MRELTQWILRLWRFDFRCKVKITHFEAKQFSYFGSTKSQLESFKCGTFYLSINGILRVLMLCKSKSFFASVIFSGIFAKKSVWNGCSSVFFFFFFLVLFKPKSDENIPEKNSHTHLKSFWKSFFNCEKKVSLAYASILTSVIIPCSVNPSKMRLVS